MAAVNIFWNVLVAYWWLLPIFIGGIFLELRFSKGGIAEKKIDEITPTINNPCSSHPSYELFGVFFLIFASFFYFFLFDWIGSIFGKSFGHIFAAILTSWILYNFCYYEYKKIEIDDKKSSRLHRIKRFSTAVIYGVTIPAILLGAAIFLDYQLDKRVQALEKITQATIAANNLKHKNDLRTLNVKHKKDLARIRSNNRHKVAQVKMKERSKRWFASIPIIGTALALWSGKDEYDDYEAWKEDNPTSTAEEYIEYKAGLWLLIVD